MILYALRKLISACVTLLLLSVITFGIFEIIPGDPITSKLGIEADQEQIDALTETLGLNESGIVRYKNWITGAVKGDLGNSIRYDESVATLIGDRIQVTALLSIMALIITIVVGIPIGIFVAKYNNKIVGIVVSIMTQIGMALPSFWIGIMITFFFGLVMKLFIPGRYVPVSEDWVSGMTYLFFPALAIAIPKIATIVRYLKNAIVEQMNADYVRTAYGKGLVNHQVVFKHVLRNALIPVITIMGMMVANVLGGSLVIEQVFTIPGIGRLLIAAISTRDYPLVQGIVLYIGMLIILINFIVDMIYHLVDPRIETAQSER